MSAVSVILDCLGPTSWSATYLGKTIVTRSRDPEHDACRTLKALGIAGLVTFKHRHNGTTGLTMSIEWGANRTTEESSTSGRPYTRKFRPYPSAARPRTRVSASA